MKGYYKNIFKTLPITKKDEERWEEFSHSLTFVNQRYPVFIEKDNKLDGNIAFAISKQVRDAWQSSFRLFAKDFAREFCNELLDLQDGQRFIAHYSFADERYEFIIKGSCNSVFGNGKDAGMYIFLYDFQYG